MDPDTSDPSEGIDDLESDYIDPSETQIPPTKLTIKYGVSTSTLFRRTFKSGLSPNHLLSQVPSRAARKLARQREKYQREQLCGFTTRELIGVGCVEGASAIASDLSTPIHPLYKRSNWREGLLTIGKGIEGDCSGRNDVVWEVLKPCLRITSSFLANCEVWPWFDALIFGDRDPIENLTPENTPKDGLQLFSFKTRKPWTISEEFGLGSTVPEYLENVATRTDISFQASDWSHGKTGGRYDEYDRPIAGCEMFFSIHLFEPLLRENLTTSERLVQQFRAAKTILHETAHAMARCIKSTFEEDQIYEPFFLDEPIGELGWSMENAIFGGRLESLVSPTSRPGEANVSGEWMPPAMGMIWQTWPSWLAADMIKNQYDRAPYMLLNASQFDDADSAPGDRIHEKWYDVWPLPLEFIENLQREEYWRYHVARKPKEAFKSYKIIGRRVQRSNHPEGKPISTSAYRQWDAEAEEDLVDDGDDRETVKRYYVRNYLRVQHETATALKSDRNDVDVYDEWKKAKGERAAMSNPQKYQSIEKHYEELRESVQRRQEEMKTQRPKLLDEDDSDYESTEVQKMQVAIGKMEMTGAAEEEELDSDEEMRICAEFMLRRR